MLASTLRILPVLALLVSPALAGADPATKPSPEEVLRLIDERMSFQSDYRGTVRLRELRKDGTENLIELEVYRRDTTRDLLIYVTKPRHLAGGGYLRMGRNLWEYEPSTGQWQRTTQRGNIISTVSCEEDFDRSRLAENYDAKDEGEDVVKGVAFRKLHLTAKEGAQPSYLQLRIWVDPSFNIVKRVGYAPSGRVLRTDIIRSYQAVKDPAAGKVVYPYKEVLEVEEASGSQFTVRYDNVTLQPLSPNMFTKTWLEGRFR
ncbi:outer membrane lipoprotein-sorting protein [Myxococcus landrumensis]|uniref:Outer membrane lipoprotein-sorting protein n=1 Tax=Myxococcus landrumensis TaxID=2813577 RepID=A0ABX7NG04_9BACT|nr:outer membrane lipoprotein-sorting protein [Myxococcus landrumus]QSQ17762.1 outer membrane lipoprotein-sorting protein [Myxococcus landrumus]